MRGKIIRIISNQYTISTDDGNEYVAIARGKLRLAKSPIVGDIVDYEMYDDVCGIEKIHDRVNELIRPKIANVDQAIVVMSAHEPDFSTGLVDRLCFLIAHANIVPIICVSKMDLATENDIVFEYIEDYKKSGITIITTSEDDILEDLKPILKGKVSVLTGQSGVGKSSLLNRINPELAITTQEISHALNRGKHTTRYTQLHEIYGGFLADTPGFSSLDFSKMTPIDLANSVIEFRPYLSKCKFNDCIHEFEPNCAIKKAVEEGKVSKIRYQNYLDILKVVKENKR